MDSNLLAVDHQRHVLQLFHAVMPGVTGVVLSDTEGAPLAHDVAEEVGPISAAALAQHRASGSVGASTMVTHHDSLYLVVFLSQQQALAWAPLAP